MPVRRGLKAALIGGCLMILAGGGPSYDPAAEYAKAIAALKANDFKAASRAAGHVTDAVPTNLDGWRLLGMATAGNNDWKGSRRAYEKAVKLAPDNPEAHAGLAMALVNLKDSKAQTEADWLKAKAQACGDSCPDAARLKDFNDKVQAAMSPAAGAPKPSAMLDRSILFGGARTGDAAYVQAVSLINERRYDDALASLSKAEATFGPHPDILTYEGYAWRKKGDYAKAETYYKQALAIAPDHIGATEYYGELKVARGDIAGARLMLAKLDKVCRFGCADAEELRRWIDAGGDPQKN